MGSIEYHLQELEIAFDKNNESHILPGVLDSDEAILDLGCGIGQSLIALRCTDKLRIGIDIDEEAIKYGIEHFGAGIQYINCDAMRIPFPSDTFNLVYSRVSVPYMNIPRVIREIKRVLKINGRVWMTLHTRRVASKFLEEALKSRKIKEIALIFYMIINGYLLKYFTFVLPFKPKHYNSWQDLASIKKLLIRNGFEVLTMQETQKHALIEGRLVQP
jgi:ubiquinone/menaquinone biosynthesis C-methylase UbiE